MSRSKQDDPVQSKRFIAAAKKAEADERPEAFESAFKKIVSPKKSTTPPKSKRAARLS